jgi:thiol:disulfide interchange protein DsbD
VSSVFTWIGRRTLTLACICTFIVATVALFSPSAQATNDGFLDPERAFVLRADVVGAEKNTLSLKFKIAPGYYMYRERFEFVAETPALNLGEPVFPNGQIKHDPTFNKEMELYFKDIEILLPLTASPQASLSAADQTHNIKLTGQGCASAGLCYPPMNFFVTLTTQPNVLGYKLIAPASQSLFGRLLDGQWRELVFAENDLTLAELLGSTGLFEIVLLFFVLGLLLALTPCVLPMVPILSVLLVGEQHQVSRARGTLLALAYVGGMSVVYTALGVAAGLSGAGLAAWLQTPWVLALFALLLATLALSMFDVFTFQMPSSIQTKLSVKNNSILGGRVGAATLMGALSALIVGPCVAAPLAGALLYISQTGDVVLGGLALFAMAWGMGVPLLLMGASAGKLMPRTGTWMEGVKQFFGVLLFATAWWMVTPMLPTWVQILGWAILALFSAVLLRTFEALGADAGFSGLLRKTLGLLLTLLCLIWLLGIASGGRSLLQPLSHLARDTATVTPWLAGTIEKNAGLSGASAIADKNAGGSSAPTTVANNAINSGMSVTGANNVGMRGVSPTVDKNTGTPSTSAAATPSKSLLLGQAIDKPSVTVPRVQSALSSNDAHLPFNRVRSIAELDAALAQATRPVMLDFYADWCVSCKEMESFTFTKPNVAQRMDQLLLLQADVTANNPEDRALLKRFKLFGPPGIIFFEPGGRERKDVRVVGFQDATRFAANLDRVLSLK